MLKIAICDDEKEFRDAAERMLKPYTEDSFYVGMGKAMQSITSHKDESVVLKVDNEYRSICVSKILYCESEDKYQRFYLQDDENCLSASPARSFINCFRNLTLFIAVAERILSI